jgi:hypothetical protein
MQQSSEIVAFSPVATPEYTVADERPANLPKREFVGIGETRWFSAESKKGNGGPDGVGYLSQHTEGTQGDIAAKYALRSRLTDSKSALGGASPERCRDSPALLSFTTT